jgi:hemoglobin/transferrin/lactoferrin receptor protein
MKLLKMIALLAVCQYANIAWSQTFEDSAEIEQIDEVVISATRQGMARNAVARQIEILNSKKLAELQGANLADAVQLSGKAFIQKSQLGGGSVVLRGFEASRVLMVIDGVRVNNATYRAGHLQDLVTFDQFALDRMELLFGGGSSMYGSDALGGVIYLKTKTANFTDSLEIKPSANFRFATAGNNTTANIGLTITSPRATLLFSGTLNDYGDLTMGSKPFSDIDTFGYRTKYAGNINGKDTALINNRPRKQVGTAYQQMDYMLKGMFKTKSGIVHGFNLNTSLSSSVPRYDRLKIIQGGQPRFAEWEYKPQNRYMASYFAEKKGLDYSHKMIAAFQRTEVARVDRRFKSPIRNIASDKVNMYTLNYDYTKKLNQLINLMAGGEIAVNTVNSKGYIENIENFTKIDGPSRYADSTTFTTSYSAYAGINGNIPKYKLYYTASARLTAYGLKANFTEQSQRKLAETQTNINNIAPSVDAGLTYLLAKNLQIKLAVQSAFRNPNVDDVTKLFESRPGRNIAIPNNNVNPERTFTGELSAVYSTKRANIEMGGYYTHINNLMVNQARGDSMMFNGTLTPVFRVVNAAGGFIQGAFANAQVQVFKGLYANASLTLTHGRYQLQGSNNFVPLDHIPPTFGKLGLKYIIKNMDFTAFMIFNGIKKNSEYSTSGEDNMEDAPGGAPNGFTPAWQTYHIAAHFKVSDNINIWANLDNILDLAYRPFSSGISAPGRNLSLTLRYAF